MDEQWCDVFGHHVEPEIAGAKRPEFDVLLDSHALPLDLLAAWCRKTVGLSPTPQVVASGVAGEFETVDTEALVMATAAEGLDRRLHPGRRRFDEEAIDRAKALVADGDIDDQMRQALRTVLTHIHEPSMPQRLTRLAEKVADAAPDCVGRINRWKRAVVEMRNAGAHGLEEPAERPATAEAAGGGQRSGQVDAILDLHALTLSLRWTLRVRLFQHCGVDDAAIAAALERSDRYMRDRDYWRRRWPAIFEAP